MLRVNLIPKRERRSLIPILVPLLGLSIALVLVVNFRDENPRLRMLDLEEQETVLAVMIRVENRVPELRNWANKLKDYVIESRIPTFVDEASKLSPACDLIQEMGASLIFSPKFFEADAFAQEKSLAKIIISVSPALRPPEIAVAGDE